MKNWYLLLLLAGLLLFASACPRDTGTEDNDSQISSTTSEGDDRAEDPVAHGEGDEENPCAENPCGEDEAPGEEDAGENPCNPCGENPCGENPCGENPCDENPCADNPCGENPCEVADEEAVMESNVVEVVLESSDGNVVLAVYPDWAPLGAARFLELVDAGFYDGAPVFRNMAGFMAQFGIPADPALTAEWADRRIPDDPVLQGNSRGMVSFAMAGPNTRTFQVFINKVDNRSSLDPQGFSAFAEVIEGMSVVDGWHITGNSTVNQGQLSQYGIEYFNQVMPEGDVIKKAYTR